MAKAIADIIHEGGVLAVEAGTGVGKTFAYLVPALLSGRRILISTATRNLQDQLFTVDLPRLMKALGSSRHAVLLKGRASYLCTHRLGLARLSGHFLEPYDLRQLHQVEKWAASTRSGDLSELPHLEEDSPLLGLVTSTRDNCLGSGCEGWQACHVNHARRKAMHADVVVVNHHLFFADQEVRESGVAELLPTVQTVIFDEAHRLNDIGVQFMGRQLGTRALSILGDEILAAGLRDARGYQPWLEMVSALQNACKGLEQALWAHTGNRQEGRLAWEGQAPVGIDAGAWQGCLQSVSQALAGLRDALSITQETSPELRRLLPRLQDQFAELLHFQLPEDAAGVRWIEIGRQARMVEAPLTVAKALANLVQSAEPDSKRSWIFTSATLGVDSRLEWFLTWSGLGNLATALQVQSPFDHQKQAALFIARDLPEAVDPDHSGALARWLVGPILRLRGRTLILATSLKAMNKMASVLLEGLQGAGIELLVQGQGSRRALLERFRQGGCGEPCVLLACGAFWEGVDVPGDALQLLVIDKLPFPSPDDPLIQARSRWVRAQGGNPFMDVVLPEAAMALKQGAGRLIRSVEDRGVLVIGDGRLLSKSYGKRLLAALPTMPLIKDQQGLEEALDGLTRVSTMDPNSCP
jgi:ATP-dependent DNA helicase DinG